MCFVCECSHTAILLHSAHERGRIVLIAGTDIATVGATILHSIHRVRTLRRVGLGTDSLCSGGAAARSPGVQLRMRADDVQCQQQKYG
jgi:hypothetical protein